MSSSPEALLRPLLSQAISGALRELLDQKHLYQTVTVPTLFFDAHLERARNSARSAAQIRIPKNRQGGPPQPASVEQEVRSAEAMAKMHVENVAAAYWLPHGGDSPAAGLVPGDGSLAFDLPTVQTFCDHCEQRWPFNPGSGASWGGHRATDLRISACLPRVQPTLTTGGPDIAKVIVDAIVRRSDSRQLFVFPYQCQNCKGAPVTFLVRRTGLKLTLCGRDPLERIAVPNFIPKARRKYFSDAIIARHAGQTLAGIFLLRTFIEQFWVSLKLPRESERGRATGDELGEAYGRTLPEAFKSQFPSLSGIYARLSAAMHGADANDEVFDSCMDELTEHFDARRLYKLDQANAPRS